MSTAIRSLGYSNVESRWRLLARALSFATAVVSEGAARYLAGTAYAAGQSMSSGWRY